MNTNITWEQICLIFSFILALLICFVNSVCSKDSRIKNQCNEHVGGKFFSNEEFEKLTNVCNKILKGDENDIFALFWLAKIKKEQGNISEAIDICNKIISIKPEHIEAHEMLCFLLYSEEQYEKAINAYINLLELKPTDKYNFYKNMGFAYKQLGQYDNAIYNYSKLIDLEPNNANKYSNRAKLYVKNGQYEEAIADYRKVIELKPKNRWAYMNIADLYTEMKQYEKAIEYYTKAIDLDPKKLLAYINIADIYIETEQYEKAIECYTKAIDLAPYDDYYSDRAEVYKKMGEKDKAIADFKKALELDPANEDAKKGLKEIENKK